MRALGPRLALLAGILDLLKGVAAVLLARVLGAGPGVEVLAAMAAVIGHSRSPFLGFGGGRGVAVGFGALFAFVPLVALAIIPVFAITILVTRYSSMGSLVASALGGVLLAIATYVIPLSPWYYVYAVGGAVLIWCSTSTTSSACSRARNAGSARPATRADVRALAAGLWAGGRSRVPVPGTKSGSRSPRPDPASHPRSRALARVTSSPKARGDHRS